MHSLAIIAKKWRLVFTETHKHKFTAALSVITSNCKPPILSSMVVPQWMIREQTVAHSYHRILFGNKSKKLNLQRIMLSGRKKKPAQYNTNYVNLFNIFEMTNIIEMVRLFCYSFVRSCCCCLTSVMSDSVQPHRRQSTRLCCPWDSPGKSTGVLHWEKHGISFYITSYSRIGILLLLSL